MGTPKGARTGVARPHGDDQPRNTVSERSIVWFPGSASSSTAIWWRRTARRPAEFGNQQASHRHRSRNRTRRCRKQDVHPGRRLRIQPQRDHSTAATTSPRRPRARIFLAVERVPVSADACIATPSGIIVLREIAANGLRIGEHAGMRQHGLSWVHVSGLLNETTGRPACVLWRTRSREKTKPIREMR